jgi:hypothetical protein
VTSIHWNGILNGVLRILLVYQHRSHRCVLTIGGGFIPVHLIWSLQPLSIRTWNSCNKWESNLHNYLRIIISYKGWWTLDFWGLLAPKIQFYETVCIFSHNIYVNNLLCSLLLNLKSWTGHCSFLWIHRFKFLRITCFVWDWGNCKLWYWI